MAGIVFPGSGEKVLASGGSMTVHFLDVGQGLSILVQSEGQNLLYDGGPRSASSYVVSYLQEQNVSEIDYLISSHYDEDHVSGLIGCLNAFQVDNVIGADYIHDSSLYGSFMDAVAAHGLEVQHPAVGAEYTFGSGEFTILSPKEISKESNANSVAIKLTNGENSFVFTGDADFNCEADMVNSGLDLSCDVLSVGHHGSATSTSWDFLQAAVPEFAVISCGAGNIHKILDSVFSLLLYVEIIVVYYWFLAMLSHCFPGLCGITVCLTHTDGLTSEVYNPHNVILFKFADDVDDAYR